jgi:hypothetical protein
MPLPMRFGDLHRVYIDALLEPSLGLADLDVVTTHLALAHLAILGKSPIFEAITSRPLARLGVLKLIPELHGNLVIAKSEQFFAEAVFFLYRPFASQEVDDSFSPAEKVVSVTPDATRSIGLWDLSEQGHWRYDVYGKSGGSENRKTGITEYPEYEC